jgi:Ni,Fe-hydrogenase III large subunit/Ni,Fe-hydrogenase III component G
LSLAEHSRNLEQALGLLLAERATLTPGPRPEDLTIRLSHAEDVGTAAAELAAHGYGFGMLVATDEEATDERDLKLRYVFEPATPTTLSRPDFFVTVVASLDPAHPELPSITADIPAANWHEREARDLFGITFTGHPDPRPLVLHDGWPKGLFPLRKRFDANLRPAREPAEEFPHLLVEGEGVLEVPVGPIHAGIIEPGHFRFSTVGEKVLHLDPRLFYTHRGLEKRVEGMTASDAFFVVERICGVCSVAHGLGFCEATEQIAGIEVPSRARVLRSLALELERLYNHLGDLGNIAAGASYHYGTSAGLRMKEAIQQVNERLTGNRFLRGLMTIGGVRIDLRTELERTIATLLSATEEALEDLVDRIENNPSFLDRLNTTGHLATHDVLNLCVTGVSARASGVDRDARRDHPHGAYAPADGFLVSVATAVEGDVHARLSVRAAEARESIRLIRAFLAGMPAGPICTNLPELLPACRIGLSAIESPRGAAMHWLRTDGAGRIDRYHLRSPSYANWPAVALAALNAIIPDFPLVNKSFELCYSCTDR